MNIIDIYNKYYLPEWLQMHMLRVAACSNLIIDNWIGTSIDKEVIIRVCLMHDIGNILKISENKINNKELKKLKEKYFHKYGTNDHKLSVEIAKIEGLTDKEIELMNSKISNKNEETLKSNSYERKIGAYCDQRCAPNGVVGLKERLEDAKKRYENEPQSIWSDKEKADYLIKCALGIEKQVMENCTLKPEDINDNSIEKYIDLLKMYNI